MPVIWGGGYMHVIWGGGYMPVIWGGGYMHVIWGGGYMPVVNIIVDGTTNNGTEAYNEKRHMRRRIHGTCMSYEEEDTEAYNEKRMIIRNDTKNIRKRCENIGVRDM
jgi:hypothetical protein